jgi:hypothetical protein
VISFESIFYLHTTEGRYLGGCFCLWIAMKSFNSCPAFAHCGQVKVLEVLRFCHSEEAKQTLIIGYKIIGRRRIFSFKQQNLCFCRFRSNLIFPPGLNRRFFARLGFRNIILNLTPMGFRRNNAYGGYYGRKTSTSSESTRSEIDIQPLVNKII